MSFLFFLHSNGVVFRGCFTQHVSVNRKKVLSNELTSAFSSLQIQQLFERLTKDVFETGMQIVEMPEFQKILQEFVGGQSG